MTTIPKTNVMRLLDAAGIAYTPKQYACDEHDLNGRHAADASGLAYEQCFKTLVTHNTNGLFVFCIPVCSELDLKKAARVAGQKALLMLHQKDLVAKTGYMRGGCSPIGMKKQFPVFIEETAHLYDRIAVSAGKRGVQLLLDPADLAAYTRAPFCDLTCG